MKTNTFLDGSEEVDQRGHGKLWLAAVPAKGQKYYLGNSLLDGY